MRDQHIEVHAYLADGYFTDPIYMKSGINVRNRNFFCFSIYKTAPLAIQPMLYTGGLYNDPDALFKKTENYVSQMEEDLYTAFGIHWPYISAFAVLENLPDITKIHDDVQNNYITLDNGATHEPILLQMPEYKTASAVDNHSYEKDPITRESLDGKMIKIGTTNQIIHYHADIASLIEIGKWMDYLRENDVYDNTRIIITADHGQDLGFDDYVLYHGGDILAFNPLLMVKDFDSKGFHVDNQFMTNADVPAIAMSELIESPVNPFTGNAVTNDMKNNEFQEVQLIKKWNTEVNNGTTFLPSLWFDVHGDNIFDRDNWENVGIH